MRVNPWSKYACAAALDVETGWCTRASGCADAACATVIIPNSTTIARRSTQSSLDGRAFILFSFDLATVGTRGDEGGDFAMRSSILVVASVLVLSFASVANAQQ